MGMRTTPKKFFGERGRGARIPQPLDIERLAPPARLRIRAKIAGEVFLLVADAPRIRLDAARRAG